MSTTRVTIHIETDDPTEPDQIIVVKGPCSASIRRMHTQVLPTRMRGYEDDETEVVIRGRGGPSNA